MATEGNGPFDSPLWPGKDTTLDLDTMPTSQIPALSPIQLPGNSVPSLAPHPMAPVPITPPQIPAPTYGSILNRLSLIVDPSLLHNEQTPHGKAHAWINKVDDLRLSVRTQNQTGRLCSKLAGYLFSAISHASKICIDGTLT